MIVKDLIKVLLEQDLDALVFALTKQQDINDLMAEKVPEVLIGTINEGKIVVITSDFEKYREEQSDEEPSAAE